MSSLSGDSESNVLEPANYVSSKPWFLTYNPDFKEVFIWKSGRRMQLKDGSSSGPVTTVSIYDDENKIISVSEAW